MTATTPFHFSPRPNRAHEIRWRAWGPEAFADAARDDRPVLLGISAVWCHWCHVMDETTYSDPENIQLINERFVAVRVDNDQRPDINARYNMGGWPTTAFLTPSGDLMAGMTYVPPDQMRDILTQVSGYYRENKDAIHEKIAALQRSRAEAQSAPADGDGLSAQIYRDILNATQDAYDPVHGGFGSEPKFPHTGAIQLLLHAFLRDGDRDALHMARKTLEHMCAGGTYDQVWGGFYRYSTNRDWSIPHYEKMLEDNALLVSCLLSLYRVSGDASHRACAERTIAYLEAWLSDPGTGCFWGSQDADEDFYPLPAAERAQREAPYVDRTIYTAWNAMAISAFLEAAWTLDRPDLAERALRALDAIWDRLHKPGAGMHRYLAARGPAVHGLLGDQASTLLACLDAYEAAGRPQDLERARELAAFLMRDLASPQGGFFDTPEAHERVGLLSLRQKPIKENAVAATALTRLARLTHDPALEDAARGALTIFTAVAESQGYFAAEYALATDLFLHPGADVKIVAPSEGREADALRAAALALAVPSRTVRLIDPADEAALRTESLPADPAPAAYVCYGTLCSAPVTTAADLIEMVARTRLAWEATRPQEPLAGPRGDRASD